MIEVYNVEEDYPCPAPHGRACLQITFVTCGWAEDSEAAGEVDPEALLGEEGGYFFCTPPRR